MCVCDHCQEYPLPLGHIRVAMTILMAGLLHRCRDIEDRRYWLDTSEDED